jgi:hypothetical protein
MPARDYLSPISRNCHYDSEEKISPSRCRASPIVERPNRQLRNPVGVNRAAVPGVFTALVSDGIISGRYFCSMLPQY